MNSADITILMSTSAIPAHPDTKFIDQAVNHARFWLPQAPLVIMADGVWGGVHYRRADYMAYLDRIRNRYENAKVIEFSTHMGQAAMLQTAFVQNQINTKYILYNEHDIVIYKDRPIEWDAIISMLESEKANVIRFSGFSEGIHPEHMYLTVGGPEEFYGTTFFKTRQWSQWPHVSKTDFYNDMLARFFDICVPTMIEEKMHSVAQSEPWTYSKIWTYIPRMQSCDPRRVEHLDARYRADRTKDPCFWG